MTMNYDYEPFTDCYHTRFIVMVNEKCASHFQPFNFINFLLYYLYSFNS